MAAAYSSRDIVQDFLRLKLRRRSAATTSWRGTAQEDAQQGLCPARARLQGVLRCACEELEQRYRGDLAAHVAALLPSGGGGGAGRRRALTAVRAELFRDGVNWGRLVALMQLCGALCSRLVEAGAQPQVEDVAGWMQESLDSAPLRGWIHNNGGWDAFVQLYGESRPAARTWTLSSVVGLLVLGAAGVTLAALFTHS